MKVPFCDLKAQYKSIKKDLDSAVRTIMKDGTFIMGKPVENFENNISRYLGAPALGCASGSDSLLLALMALDIKKGDEVITSPFTFFATAGAIVRLGATPVFVDIDERTFNIDPAKIEKAVTKRTKAIIPIHMFGHPVDMEVVMKIAKKYKIVVIEDACQAIGAEYKGKKAGTIGDFGCFSFFPTKNLGAAGDGGLITVKNPSAFQQVKIMRVHGAGAKYHYDILGINSRLDSIQASILDVKLKRLNSWNKRRAKIADIYNKKLAEIVKIPTVIKGATHVYHQYAVTTDQRDALLKHLNDSGIGAVITYPVPLHLQKCFGYLGYKKGDLPVAEKTCLQILSLPVYPEMNNEQINFVINKVKSFFNK